MPDRLIYFRYLFVGLFVCLHRHTLLSQSVSYPFKATFVKRASQSEESQISGKCDGNKRNRDAAPEPPATAAEASLSRLKFQSGVCNDAAPNVSP